MDGQVWVEKINIHIIANGGIEYTVLSDIDIDDDPVDGAVNVPISSNWAYGHINSSNPHPIVTNNGNVICNKNEVVYNV